MHELPVTQSILEVVLRHARMNGVSRVHAINLAVGKLSDLEDEWIQQYFDYLSKGTLAEGAKLNIERIPVVFRCTSCRTDFEVDVRKMKDILCPECGKKDFTLVSGREYYIKDMEAQ
ncbi:MAG TPA: hydrogenase maturation nickel metallochaperone HypA [Deltaproteobacteria bacterium]|jgi:hydrogenase nickel incorporation protein HypA/HybF|nr:hydrogenase maturation nickel metallochaperone HypA [Deltaproteobacteria bacterium]HQI02109.1 hydrogenase maturation nickel metallochaperone HypA [Deltaproteobacteria bacterium]HQJ09041.1 hydrogenase maturation nickel metallochaperone HypA [Deltaproteobacteria bacterium]